MKKYEPHTAPKLLKLKREFTNKRLEDISQDPDERITELESVQVQMDNIDIVSKITDRDLMIHIMNCLPEQYDPIIDTILLESQTCYILPQVHSCEHYYQFS